MCLGAVISLQKRVRNTFLQPLNSHFWPREVLFCVAQVISHGHECMAGVDSDGQGLLKPVFLLKTTRSVMVLCYCLGSPYSQ